MTKEQSSTTETTPEPHNPAPVESQAGVVLPIELDVHDESKK